MSPYPVPHTLLLLSDEHGQVAEACAGLKQEKAGGWLHAAAPTR